MISFASVKHIASICFAIVYVSCSVAQAEDKACFAANDCIEQTDWSALKSKDKTLFRKSFQTLAKEDHSKLYSEIRKLTFEDTDEDKIRAVMIARVIAQERRKISPTKKAYYYWRDWYGSTEMGSPEHLIPAYLLFNFHEKTARKISDKDRETRELRKRIESYRNNEQGKLYGRTSEFWINFYTKRLNEYEVFPFLFDATTNAFRHDEGEVLKEYFRLFDIIHHQGKYGSRFGYQLPLPAVLETAIQTEKMWVDAFSSRLECDLVNDNFALMTQIAALDPNNATLKACLKRRLENQDDMPTLMETLSFISRHDALRLDRDLYQAVSAIDENHPFSSILLVRRIILSSGPAPAVTGRGRYIWSEDRRKLLGALNANRTYCEPERVANFIYIDTPTELNEPQKFGHTRHGAPVITVKTPSGYLTGHNRGEFGGGLLYYPDKNSEPKVLNKETMIAIIESEEPGVYWGLSGLNHMMPGTGRIQRIDARTNVVTIHDHKRMPLVTNNVSLLKNGDLFMDFWNRETTTYTRKNGKIITQNPSSDFNPPVLLTQSGEITGACQD